MTEKTLDYKIALLVDGPNMAETDNNEVIKIAESYGLIVYKEVFLNRNVPEKQSEFYLNSGYKINFGLYGNKDIDTYLASRAAEYICSSRYGDINIIGIVSGDSDFLPLVYMTQHYNKKSLIISPENSISVALKNSCDRFGYVKSKSSNNGCGK